MAGGQSGSGHYLIDRRLRPDLVRHPLILAIASEVLGSWCDRINLNLTQGIEIHPGGASAQFPHRDEDMWGGPKGEMEYLLNVIWPLNDFAVENGATRIWPNSRPSDTIEAQWPGVPVVAEMEPGAALLFLGSTLHAAGGNKTASARRGLIISYCLGWLKPFENQWLCYPPHIARQFDPDLARLVGYSLHKPNLGNYEGQCPSILLGDNPLCPYPAATDALHVRSRAGVGGIHGRHGGVGGTGSSRRARAIEALRPSRISAISSMPGDPAKFTAPDWRDAEQYRYLLELDRAGWAWEWLRRHAAYEGVAAHLAFTGGGGVPAPRFDVVEVGNHNLVSEWGLCFRRVSKLPRHAGAAALERPI